MDLSLKSITASSVADFNFSEEPSSTHQQEGVGYAAGSAYSCPGGGLVGIHHKLLSKNITKELALKEFPNSPSDVSDPVSIMQVGRLRASTKNTAVQTDPLTSSSEILESLCELSLSDIEKVSDDASESFLTHDQYQERIRAELAAINWTASLSAGFGNNDRPDAPDIEMMTLGHRFSQAETPQTQLHDSELQGEENTGRLHQATFKSFVILPSSDVPKPRANRPSSSLIIIDYPNSPPSSEITVPSDNLSDVSTFNSSFISTPNSAKYTALLSTRNHSDTSHKSAFSKLMPLIKSSTTSVANGSTRKSKKLIIPDVKEPKEIILKKTNCISGISRDSISASTAN